GDHDGAMTDMKLQPKPATAAIVCLLMFAATSYAQSPQIETTYKAGVTTVRMEPVKISGERDEYYSLHVAPSFKYDGKTPTAPEYIDFEIQTVVKSRRLNPDLYIIFAVDGETIFLSSNRWAVKNPVPGRRMIGERIAMRMPLGTFLKLANAKDAAIRMGGTIFRVNDEQKAALLELTGNHP
ncbi:MAG: hypothetical protein ACRD6N_09045, partial [Pyrinomonadaceae bacterium]